MAADLYVQIPHFQRVFFDEFAAGFDFVPHQDAEEVVGGGGFVHFDPEERAVGWVERRVAELLGVHLTQALETGDGEALFAGRAHGRQQAAEIGEAGRVFPRRSV